MTFFESLVVLILVAVLLLQVARRMELPYPAMLAAAGVLVALVPGAPSIPIAPATALALFIAPVLMDAAFDYPLAAARHLVRPLIVFAVGAVLVTAGAVAVVGVHLLGLPIAAAIVVGAIVAPPDAAAATAVLVNLPVARRIEAVLKGESLFNDATALLLFTAALTVQSRGGLDLATGAQIALAVPGGIAFGLAFAFVTVRVTPMLGNTVGATLWQFASAFLCWIVAEHLHLSAVLAVVAAAMAIASSPRRQSNPRMRVHSYAVWTTVVFLLNVVAFLLMGMQAQGILAAMEPAELARAGWFAAAVIATVIVSRFVVAYGYGAYVRRLRRGSDVHPLRRGDVFLVGWTGMRGLVTLATAFALPGDFPSRDTVVLAAFCVVLATLVIQGGTLAPLIRRLGAARPDETAQELGEARVAMAEAALAHLNDRTEAEAEDLRRGWTLLRGSVAEPHLLDARRGLALDAIGAARARLDELRGTHGVSAEAYLQLEEELDWKQLAVTSDDERRIDES